MIKNEKNENNENHVLPQSRKTTTVQLLLHSTPIQRSTAIIIIIITTTTVLPVRKHIHISAVHCCRSTGKADQSAER